MSSGSLTPPPLSSPNKLVQDQQNIAPRSPRNRLVPASTSASTRVSTSQSTRHVSIATDGLRRSSQSSKRAREANFTAPEHTKRVRSGTPIELSLRIGDTTHDEEDDGKDLEIEQGRAGPSNYADDGFRQVIAPQQETSEAGEGGDSVLFSEQVETQNSTLAPGSTSTAIQGNMADYLPQPEATVAGTEETEDLEEYREEGGQDDTEEEADEDEAGEGEVEDEQPDDELNESYDGQDGDVDEEEEDGADTPQWLTEPHVLVQEPADRMSRVLEGDGPTIRNREVTSELTERASEGFEEEQQQHQHQRTDEAEGEDQWEMERPMSPQSYHSGDTDEYEMSHRPVLERTAIKKDIKKFVDSVKCLKDPESGEVAYRIVDRLGEGELTL